MPVIKTIQVRRGTAAAWTSANPTLAAGEIGFETDTLFMKIGNGVTAWTSLAYTIKSPTLGQNSASIAVPSTLSVTLLASITVPAGTVGVGDSIKIHHEWTNNNNANQKFSYVAINGDLGAPAQQITNTTNQGAIGEVQLKITSLTNIRVIRILNGQSYNTTTSAPINKTVSDVSANSFTIGFYGQKLTSTSDTLVLEHYFVNVQKT